MTLSRVESILSSVVSRTEGQERPKMSSITKLGISNLRLLRSRPVNNEQVRHSGAGLYRRGMYQSARKSFQWKLSWLGGFGTALWMCWGFYTEPEVAFAKHFGTSDPSKWTDEELGIPPEDKEEL